MSTDPARLELEPDEMRRLGYRMVDMVVEHWAVMVGKPAAVTAEVEVEWLHLPGCLFPARTFCACL